VVPRPLDRLDPPDEAGRHGLRLRLRVERPGLLRHRGRPGYPEQIQRPTSLLRTGDVTPMNSLLIALVVLATPADEPKAAGPFAQRGDYITFMRMPTYDLADWRRIVDAIHADGGNTLLLWVAGAFRSEKYPITWRNN